MSRISSFKREWDEDKAVSSVKDEEIISSTIAPAASQTSTNGTASRPSGKSRFATIMAALQASDGNKATGKMTPSPVQPTMSMSQESTAAWVNSVSGSSGTQNSANSGGSSKRTRDSTEEDEEAAKKQRSSREKAKAGMQTNLTVMEKAVTGSATGSEKLVITLSYEQSQILELVKKGSNIFFTGSAGTGKSVLLREIIKALRKKHGKAQDAVAITASTGIAACNIGGVTLHSFSGIGIGEGTPENLAVKVRKNRNALSRWLRCKVLIIDEVSMLDGDLFDRLARVACIVRKSPKPFGGIQLIVTGDFFQLPPVMKGGQPKFAFEAEKWSECVERTFNLSKVFRQKDPRFVDMLNDMRFGRLTPSSIRTFYELSRPIPDDGIQATELFPRREDVERSNNSRMAALPGKEESFPARDAGTITDPVQRDKMLQNFMAPKELSLKVNAQVMLLKNIDETLVNGSVGRIIGFHDATEVEVGEKGELIAFYAPEEKKKNAKNKQKEQPQVLKKYPLVEFRVPRGTRKLLVMPEAFKVELPNGEIQVSRTQLPLILSWAMSIHKSQGQTLDRVKVDCGRIFEKGQAYVALSRATSLEGLQVLNFDPKKVQAHDKVKAWSQTLECITHEGE
ncbi:DNA repair and recombination protein pif1, mitochondrial OS=Schizosaccharomyces pombe (strain 972 / ATCC 24843) GN=pif1 PE=1 SV=1 [Rhizoctonia solani AG-1 IB]|uniref:ATP-dependent DNA helicase PIF1 n=1 Tax=Thanatephorus cucumeris (strain AG1-IB / isolate 7/3/14) TaxID=1108050 RepID=A0A0B7FZH9_THACB|nr:DNA repair and recombination protein pif1, mitochondrial OS=Schizosaccharomyces pombe (strain 972 / ATCC 24843) GN=pif1 PE=1 SV=1 [Rhizoctonia solani AG-1 IB]